MSAKSKYGATGTRRFGRNRMDNLPWLHKNKCGRKVRRCLVRSRGRR